MVITGILRNRDGVREFGIKSARGRMPFLLYTGCAGIGEREMRFGRDARQCKIE
jgi:hypothetical protein